MGWWQSVYHTVINQLALFRITDVIDIAIVSYIVYKALRFIRDTRTVQLLKGVVLVILLTQISFFAKLNTLYFILSNFLQLGIIALLIVFQPELRRALEHVGRQAASSLFVQHNESDVESQQVIREISKAAQAMSNTRTGALIVIENRDNIDSLMSSGVHISAKVTSELLENIFVPDTPLHDGAVIIRDSKVYAAGCFLPKPQKEELISKALGSRHRAAIGMSEVSDAVIVVVSEETGTISIAENGSLTRFYNKDTLRKLLTQKLVPEKPESKKLKDKASKKKKKNAPDAKKEKGADK